MPLLSREDRTGQAGSEGRGCIPHIQMLALKAPRLEVGVVYIARMDEVRIIPAGGKLPLPSFR